MEELQDGQFYWVQFSKKDEQPEIARYRKSDNRLRFTNGSQCQPQDAFFVDKTPVKYKPKVHY